MNLEFGYSVSYGYCIFDGFVHIIDEGWPRNYMHIGEGVFPNCIWFRASVHRRTFPIEGIVLDN